MKNANDTYAGAAEDKGTEDELHKAHGFEAEVERARSSQDELQGLRNIL